MVPIISLPTFIPLVKSSERLIAGFLRCSSLRVDATDIATSMTAPSAEIRIPAKRSSPTRISVACPTKRRLSTVETLRPEIPAKYPNNAAEMPETRMPNRVPSAAQSDLTEHPATKPSYVDTVGRNKKPDTGIHQKATGGRPDEPERVYRPVHTCISVGKILRELSERKRVEVIEAEACPDHIHMLVSVPPHISVATYKGYVKSKCSLMIFDKHTNLKYKYGNRHFGAEGIMSIQ